LIHRLHDGEESCEQIAQREQVREQIDPAPPTRDERRTVVPSAERTV
jgi:hypothetical protein